MKILFPVLIILLFFNCSSTSLTKRWKNPEYKNFIPKNILVIGVTPNLKARFAFESKAIKELNARGVNALQSHIVFEESFHDTRKTEKEIEAEIDKLIDTGYDAILISVVKGIGSNISYSGESSKLDYRLRKFIGYYLLYQEVFYDQNYYDKYKVYTIETSLYRLKKDSEKSLIWYANYDLVDPRNVRKSINNYVRIIIKSLEKEGIIPKNGNNEMLQLP